MSKRRKIGKKKEKKVKDRERRVSNRKKEKIASTLIKSYIYTALSVHLCVCIHVQVTENELYVNTNGHLIGYTCFTICVAPLHLSIKIGIKT